MLCLVARSGERREERGELSYWHTPVVVACTKGDRGRKQQLMLLYEGTLNLQYYYWAFKALLKDILIETLNQMTPCHVKCCSSCRAH